MKDWFAKLLTILVIGLLESTVGLPIFFTSSVVRLGFLDQKTRLIWLGSCGLLFAFFWGIPWWVGVLFLATNILIYEKLQLILSNSWLRLLTVVLPTSFLIALISGMDFSVRSLLYGGISMLLVVMADRYWWISKYQKKYL